MIEHLAGDHTLGVGYQRDIDIHHVGSLQQFLHGIHLFKAASGSFLCIDERIVAQHLYAETLVHNVRNALGNIAHADLAEGLAENLRAKKIPGRDAGKASGTAAFVCLIQAALEEKEQCHRQLSHGIGVGGGGVDHLNAALFSGLHIDGITADAVLGDDLQLFRPVHHLRRHGCAADDDGINLLDVVKGIHDGGLLPQKFSRLGIDIFT